MADASDEDLLLMHHNGETEDAFAVLMGRYTPEMRAYLRRFLYNEHDAEDVFQMMFLKVHEKSEQFDFGSGKKFRPWLYTIATNQAIDHQRRTKRHKLVSLDQRMAESAENETGSLINLLESKEPGPDDRQRSIDDMQIVRRAIRALPPELQEVTGLLYLQDLKYREVAEATHVAIGTVKSRQNRSMRLLRELIAMHPEHADDPPPSSPKRAA